MNDIFTQLGLTGQETRVYLALLKLEEARTGIVCERTGIASSHIYTILYKLIDKGLVSYRLKNKRKIFMAAPPESLNELIVEKQEQLQKEIGALEQQKVDLAITIKELKKKTKQETQPNYKYYEGIVGIKSLWHDLNNLMTERDTVKIYSTKKEGYERMLGFYTEHHKLRQQKKVKEQLFYPLTAVAHARKRLKTFKFTEIKFLDQQNTGNWGVCGDTFFCFHITGKMPKAFLMTNPTMAQTFHQTFDQLWAIAKTLDDF